MSVWLRRLIRLAFLGAVGAVVTTWFRNRLPAEEPAGTPGSAEWPELRPLAEPSDGGPAEPVTPSPVPAATAAGAAAVALATGWVAPDDEGSCPLSHPVKVKESSGIYHVPEGRVYDRTHADRCYRSGDDAEADGFRRSKV